MPAATGIPCRGSWADTSPPAHIRRPRTRGSPSPRHEELIREAAAGGANIIVTQERFLTPYFRTVEDSARFGLADPLPGPVTDRLGKLAGEPGIVLVPSLRDLGARLGDERFAGALRPEDPAVVSAIRWYLESDSAKSTYPGTEELLSKYSARGLELQSACEREYRTKDIPPGA